MKNQKELKDSMSLNQLGQALGADKIEMAPPSGNGKAEDDILRQAIQIQRAKNEHLTERMNKLLTGKSKAPNEFVAYLLNTFRDGQAEMESLRATMEQLEMQTRQVRERIMILRGEQKKCVQDIQQWDRPLGAPQSKEN